MPRQHAVPRASATLAILALLALAACTDAFSPPPDARASHAPRTAGDNGRRLGQCFAQLGLTGTQVPPDAARNATAIAPEGEVVTRVAVKAGTPCWFTPDSTKGSYTIVVGDVPCYLVAGLGASTATVVRIADGPTCKDISHIEITTAPAPPPTGLLQLCDVVSGQLPANAPHDPFVFLVAGQQVAVPIHGCAPAIELPAGTVSIVEQPHPSGMFATGATTAPPDRLVAFDAVAQSATVTIVAGSTTVATIANLWIVDPGQDLRAGP